MTTTVKEGEPFVIPIEHSGISYNFNYVSSNYFPDCIIRVPVDESKYHDYKLHLCMLYDSAYFHKVI